MRYARFPLVFAAILLLIGSYLPAFAVKMPAGEAGTPLPQQSHSGPLPPVELLRWEQTRQEAPATLVDGQVVLAVPAYLWRHGCGPTTLAMIAGYWDALGYGDLIPGNGSSQTYEVNQAIASGGQAGAPSAPGSERHYEDYAAPQDDYSHILTDAVIAEQRAPHRDDSIADFMKTSRSDRQSPYGASWSNDIGPAWVGYVRFRNSGYAASYRDYFWQNSSLSWEVLKQEIDSGRPMLLLVDSDRDGAPDHFVPAIGYREATHEYAFLDTWQSAVRWASFTGLNREAPWGIWGGTALYLKPPQQANLPYKTRLPLVAR